MKEYKVVETKKDEAEKIMNDMAKQGWEVIAVTYYTYWNISLIVTFARDRIN